MFMCVFCLLAPVLFEESSIIAPNQQIHNLFGNIWIDLSLLFCDGLCYLKTGITSESFKFVGDMHSSLQLFLVFVRCDR